MYFFKLINNLLSLNKENHNRGGSLDLVLISIDFDNFSSPFSP